jgi:hypothetical protein
VPDLIILVFFGSFLKLSITISLTEEERKSQEIKRKQENEERRTNPEDVTKRRAKEE